MSNRALLRKKEKKKTALEKMWKNTALFSSDPVMVKSLVHLFD